MLTFPYDIHLPQLVGLLLSHRSQEDFFFFKKRMGGMTCSFQFASSSLLLTIIHRWSNEASDVFAIIILGP